METSLTKTLAHKLRVHVSAVYDRYRASIDTPYGTYMGLQVRLTRHLARRTCTTVNTGVAMPTVSEVQVPSSKDRRRLEVPAYLHEQLRQVATRESRTVASVASELLHYALRDHRPAWIPHLHLQLFNDRARRVLDLAKEEALSFGHHYLGTEHLLLGLLREDQGSAGQFLASNGVDLDTVRTVVVRQVGRGNTTPAGDPEYSPRARRALALAVDGARNLGHDHVGTEHILLGIAREGQGFGAGILERSGINLDNLRQGKGRGLSQLD